MKQLLDGNEPRWHNSESEEKMTINFEEVENRGENKSGSVAPEETSKSPDTKMKNYWMPVKYTKRRTGRKLIGEIVKNSNLDRQNFVTSKESYFNHNATPIKILHRDNFDPKIFINNYEIQEFNKPLYLNQQVDLHRELDQIMKRRDRRRKRRCQAQKVMNKFAKMQRTMHEKVYEKSESVSNSRDISLFQPNY